MKITIPETVHWTTTGHGPYGTRLAFCTACGLLAQTSGQPEAIQIGRDHRDERKAGRS